MNYRSEHEGIGRSQPPTAIEQAIAALHKADAEARSSLPALPPGFEWHADVEVSAASSGGMTARLIYTVRPAVGSALNPRHPSD